MSVTAGDIIDPVRIRTRDPDTGLLEDRDITAALWVGDAESDTVVTITEDGDRPANAGKYKASFTVPTVADGDEIELIVTDTLTGDEDVIWREQGRGAGTSEAGDVTTYATRANVEQKVGPDNLAIYADLNNNEDADEIAAAIADDITEAATDMAVEWAQHSSEALPEAADLSAVSARWMLDTNAYGAAVKAFFGRTVDDGLARSPEDVDRIPTRVGTAYNEWVRRLAMLRTGEALKDWQEEQGTDTADAGTFESVPMTFDPIECDENADDE